MSGHAKRTDEEFERHRGYLTGLGYRMLGSVAEAEDVVQEAWLRWQAADRDAIRSPRAWLSRIVTRLCLDTLKSARRRRETYIGPWLPEPLLEDPALQVLPDETMAHDVSVALMLTFERLSPLERAAFILHDVFGMPFGEIAAALGRGEAACRQLASRARARVGEGQRRYEMPAEAGEPVIEAFFEAARSGDTDALRDLLAETASLSTDGGGRLIAALNVIRGADRISRFFAGLSRKSGGAAPRWLEPAAINGLPGRILVDWDGTLQTVAFEVGGGRIQAIYITRNPDKLAHVAALVPQELRGTVGSGH